MTFERIAISRANYWIGFALDLVVSLAMIVTGVVAGGLVPALAAFAAGWLTFTLFEYALHRWAYHGPRSPFSRIHGLHHRDSSVLLGAPFFYSLGVTAIALALARLIIPAPLAAVFAGTMLLAYACQSVVHHLAHGWPGSWRLRPEGLLGRLRRHHMIHHHSERPVNHGMSTRFWDRVFGTIATSSRSRRSA